MARVTIKAAGKERPGALPGEQPLPLEDAPPKPRSVTADLTTCIDSKGMTLGWKQLNPIQRLRFFDMLGPESVRNQEIVGRLAVVATCRSIDGEAVPFPASRRELEATYSRIDDDGIQAILISMKDTLGLTDDPAAEDKEIERAKNS